MRLLIEAPMHRLQSADSSSEMRGKADHDSCAVKNGSVKTEKTCNEIDDYMMSESCGIYLQRYAHRVKHRGY